MPPLTLDPTLRTVTHAFGMWKFAALLAVVFIALFVLMVLVGNMRDKRRRRMQARTPSRD